MDFKEYDLNTYKEDFAAFMKDNKDMLLARSAAKRVELLAYLQGLKLDNTLFVDIGYTGTINLRLERILRQDFAVKKMDSLLLLASPVSNIPAVLKYDSPYLIQRIMENVASFESLVKDQVGPLLGYSDGKAVYGKYEWDEIQKCSSITSGTAWPCTSKRTDSRHTMQNCISHTFACIHLSVSPCCAMNSVWVLLCTLN